MDGNQNSEIENKNGEARESKNKILPVVTGILVGIVGISIIVLIVLSLLSPKNTYFRLLSCVFSDVLDMADDVEKSVIGQVLTMDTKNKLTLDTVIRGNIKTDNKEIKDWVKNLESFELTSYDNIDFNNGYSDASAKIFINGEEFLSGTLVQNNNIVSADVNGITNGFVTVDNNKLDELWDKIGYNGPDNINLQFDLLKKLNFSKSEFNTLKTALTKSASKFTTVFDDEDFSRGTGEVKYDEGSITCNYIDFNINSVKFNDAVVVALEELTSKDKYVDVIYKIFSSIDYVNGYEVLTRDEFWVNLESMIEEIRSLKFSEEDGFIVRLYYKGANVLKIEVLSIDYNQKVLEFTMVYGKDSSYYMYTSDMVVYEDKVSKIDDVTTHVLNIDYIDYETGNILEGYGSEIVFKLDSSVKNTQTINMIEKVRLLDYTADKIDISLVEPTVIKDYTLKCSINGNNNNIELILTDNDSDFSSTFCLNTLINKKASFEVVNTANSFNTVTESNEAIIRKKDEIVNNWTNFKNSNKERVLQFETAVSMYLNMFLPVDYYEEDFE